MMSSRREDFQIPTTGFFGGRALNLSRGLREIPLIDAAVGGVVLLLAIAGLSGFEPRAMVAFACMASGAALAVEAAGVALRYQGLIATHGDEESLDIRSAFIAQILGGGAGMALGLVGLFGIEPLVLLPIATVVLGGSLLLGTGAEVEVDVVESHFQPSRARCVIHQAVVGAAGARLLAGFSSIVLGALALAGIASLTLTLAATLMLGVAIVLGSISAGDRWRSAQP